MNSTDYTRLAQAADEFGYTIVAFAEIPPSEGTYPGVRAVLHNPDRPDERAYATSMGVLPDGHDHTGDNGESVPPRAFFCASAYDLSRERAFERFTTEIAALHV